MLRAMKTRSAREHDGRLLYSDVVIEPTYQKSKRWPVSMVILAVDERLKTSDSIETLDSPSTLISRLNGNYTYIAATRLPNRANGFIEIGYEAGSEVQQRRR